MFALRHATIGSPGALGRASSERGTGRCHYSSWGAVASSEEVGRCSARRPTLSRFQDWNEMDFVMHWGKARVRPSNAEAVAARGTDGARSNSSVVRHG
jgi:hypothetical protein